eukprot:gene29105-32317_t
MEALSLEIQKLKDNFNTALKYVEQVVDRMSALEKVVYDNNKRSIAAGPSCGANTPAKTHAGQEAVQDAQVQIQASASQSDGQRHVSDSRTDGKRHGAGLQLHGQKLAAGSQSDGQNAIYDGDWESEKDWNVVLKSKKHLQEERKQLLNLFKLNIVEEDTSQFFNVRTAGGGQVSDDSESLEGDDDDLLPEDDDLDSMELGSDDDPGQRPHKVKQKAKEVKRPASETEATYCAALRLLVSSLESMLLLTGSAEGPGCSTEAERLALMLLQRCGCAAPDSAPAGGMASIAAAAATAGGVAKVAESMAACLEAMGSKWKTKSLPLLEVKRSKLWKKACSGACLRDVQGDLGHWRNRLFQIVGDLMHMHATTPDSFARHPLRYMGVVELTVEDIKKALYLMELAGLPMRPEDVPLPEGFKKQRNLPQRPTAGVDRWVQGGANDMEGSDDDADLTDDHDFIDDVMQTCASADAQSADAQSAGAQGGDDDMEGTDDGAEGGADGMEGSVDGDEYLDDYDFIDDADASAQGGAYDMEGSDDSDEYLDDYDFIDDADASDSDERKSGSHDMSLDKDKLEGGTLRPDQPQRRPRLLGRARAVTRAVQLGRERSFGGGPFGGTSNF